MRKRYSRSYTVLSFLTMFSYREQPFGSLLFLLYLFLRKEALQDGILSLLGGQAQRLQL